MKLSKRLNQQEGRKLEFKEVLPSKSNLAKTVVAFANDAGGEIYIGVKNKPREIIGVDDDKIFELEEKIASIIYDNCFPSILPGISILNIEGKTLLRVIIFKGSNPPYHQKNKEINAGTYIRVGSTNRIASEEIIQELIRQKKNISFDGENAYNKKLSELKIDGFKDFFSDKTGEKLTKTTLRKLNLIKDEQGDTFPTNALILLSDDEIKDQIFPFAKIECARFKGTVPGNFIDQKTIEGSIATQAEEAFNFVLRHISHGTTGYNGVYRQDRWEYPIEALREVIRKAIHLKARRKLGRKLGR